MIFLVCVLLVPFFGFYVAASDSIGLDTAQDFSSFSGTDLTVLFGIALINLLFIACFVFVLMTFLRYKPLRRDLVNCLWAFILIVIPLLIIAGIVEGLLITLLGQGFFETTDSLLKHPLTLVRFPMFQPISLIAPYNSQRLIYV